VFTPFQNKEREAQMVNLTSIQVVSNEPEGLDLQFDGQAIRVISADEVSSTKSSLFLLSTVVKQDIDIDLQQQNWVETTKNFVDTYQSMENVGIMLTVQMMKTAPKQSAEMINECLEIEDPFQKISVSVPGEDALWNLVLDASLRSDLSCLLVLEEAIAACTPFKNQEVLEQDALRSLSMDAANSLKSIYSTFKETNASLKTIKEENDLLLSQLHSTQEELEKSFLRGQELEVWKSSVENEGINTAGKLETIVAENELLCLQLQQVKEELDRHFTTLKDLENQQGNETIPERLARTAPLDSKLVSAHFEILFDRNFFCEQAGKKRLALLNYKYMGWKRGINPHPLFDTEFYMEQIGLSLKDLGMSPLMHYLRYGARLNLSTHRDFDAAWYKRKNPDVATSDIPMVVHFIAFGWKEGRNPSPEFDCNWYLSQYPEVAAAGLNPLVDFVLQGREEGRKPNASA